MGDDRHYTGGTNMACYEGGWWVAYPRERFLIAGRWAFRFIIRPLDLVRCGVCRKLRRRKNGDFLFKVGPWTCFRCVTPPRPSC